MAIDKNSNSFTFTFAIVMVVVVGTILAFLYDSLKPFQDENVRREKMQNILSAMNVQVSRDEAPEAYEQYIVDTKVVNAQGRAVEGDAFNTDVMKQYRDERAGVVKEADLRFPIYIADRDGRPLYILPVVGTGLWGPIWGYVAVADDARTVVGSTFDHKGETPGLGAEINTKSFGDQFKGKKIADESGGFTSIKVYKGGTQTTSPHGVDGISGGTITSDGVHEMLERTLSVYYAYLSSVADQASKAQDPASEPIAATQQETVTEEQP